MRQAIRQQDTAIRFNGMLGRMYMAVCIWPTKIMSH